MDKQEAIQLLEEMNEKECMLCSHCNSILLKKDGIYITKFKVKRQYYQCLECSKRFIIKDVYYHSKTPIKIMRYVIKITKQLPSLPNYKIADIVKQTLNHPITKKGVKLIIKRFSK